MILYLQCNEYTSDRMSIVLRIILIKNMRKHTIIFFHFFFTFIAYINRFLYLRFFLVLISSDGKVWEDGIFNLIYLTFIDITTPVWKIANSTMIFRLLQSLFVSVSLIALRYN